MSPSLISTHTDPPRHPSSSTNPADPTSMSTKPQTQAPEVPDIIHIPEKDLHDDLYYPENYYPIVKSPLEIHSDRLFLSYAFGFDATKRYNIYYLSNNVLLTCIGNAAVLINVLTQEQQYIFGVRGGGVSAVAVHPRRQFFAVAERHEHGPNIYIYGYPDLRLYRVLRRGSEKAFSNICFNANGDKLASVGTDPDYMLTLWDWRKERVILRCKAFSQDIYNVAFSPNNDDQLTTSGMGHIKFWKMSATFTGLKLQGQLGKFGLTELSDISAFAQLSDGKVISSTETGSLLLWDGGFIKCEFLKKGSKGCHVGPIEVCLLQESELITAGEDGYIRIWDLEAIDNADVLLGGMNNDASKDAAATTSTSLELEPLDELFVGKDVKIRGMIKSPEAPSEYIIQDSNGGLLKIDMKKRSTDRLLSFHSGGISSVQASPTHHSIVSLSKDGWVRVYDPLLRITLGKIKFSAPGTVMAYLPKTLDPTGCSFVAGFSDGVVRFVRHFQRNSKSTSLTFSLRHVFKPHSKPVSAITFSPLGNVFATSSEDKTIFLFSINAPTGSGAPFDSNATIQPIGFIQLQHTVISLSWANESNKAAVPDRARLLATYDNGTIAIIETPLTKTSENTSTFLIDSTLVTVSPWKLEVFRQQKEKTEKAEAEEMGEGRRSKIEGSKESDSLGSGGQQDAGIQEREIDSGGIRGALCTLYLSQNCFLVCVETDTGGGELRACSIDNPRKSRLLLSHHTPLTGISTTYTKKYLLVGARDGTIFCRPFSHLADVSLDTIDTHEQILRANHDQEEGIYWKHSCHNGPVTSMASTFDDALICSAGADGGIFVWKSTMDDLLTPQNIMIELQNLPSVEDIVDPNSFNIEMAKRLAGKEANLKQHEASKEATKAKIRQIRDEFTNLFQENEYAPIDEKLPKTFFQIDPDLQTRIAEETAKKIEYTKSELAWATEKEELALKKLKSRFLDALQTERIEIKAFKAPISVATFRTFKLTSNILEMLNSHWDVQGNAKEEKAAEGISGQVKREDNESKGRSSQPKQRGANYDTDKYEARKQLRLERAARRKELIDAKPDDTYEDPKDVAAIRYAEAHMGDYKLKSDKSYIVPESERVDADIKKRQMVLLKESVHKLAEDFNQKVISLRNKKGAVIKETLKRNEQIQRMTVELQKLGYFESLKIWVPSVEKTEYPEDRYTVNAQDIQNERMSIEVQTKANSQYDDLANFVTSNAHAEGSKAVESAVTSQLSRNDTQPAFVPNPLQENGLSSQERLERDLLIVRLNYQRENLYKKIMEDVTEFDELVKDLSRERLWLGGDIKFAEMRFLVLYEEWVLLKEFEKHDNALKEKLLVRRSERADLEVKIRDIQAKLMDKKKDVENIIQKGKEVEMELRTMLGENNKYEDVLTKIFRKRIKRPKRRNKPNFNHTSAQENQDMEEINEDFESDSESDYSSASSDGEAERDFCDGCPPGCDEKLYQRVIQLRDLRLDHEFDLSEIQSSIEAMRKDNDALMKRAKLVDSALKQTESEIQEFQTLKQQKLNEINVTIPMRLHQVQYFENDALPPDMSQALVFVNDCLDRLGNRIAELEQENVDIQREHKEMKKIHIGLRKSKREKQSKLAELEERSNEVQILKFGQIIDLEKLERIGVNKTANELRSKLQEQDVRNLKEIHIANAEVTKLKDELTQATIQNTLKLDMLVQLTNKLCKLENTLNHFQSDMTAEYAEQHQMESQNKLVRLISTQEKEIERLRKELSVLK